MENTKRVWLLGAPDPEMERIEALLRECGETFVFATDAEGRRVHPGNAYRVESPEIPDGTTALFVECIDEIPSGAVRIDHHRPGDPGFGVVPRRFMNASSIGQVIAELAKRGITPPGFGPRDPLMRDRDHRSGGHIMLGRDGWAVTVETGPDRTRHTIPIDHVYAAAADHCLGAAYRGECPGVRPDTLMEWRAEVRAKFQRRSKAEVLADIEAARNALRLAKKTELAPWIFVADLRGQHVPELPEAAAREGQCFLSTVRDRDGREKVGCMGGTPGQIRAFLEVWAPNEGLVDIYGDPMRGFAGGYLPAKEKK